MQDWQEFVAARALHPGPLPDCALADLSHHGLIRVSGEDAREFLQGQLTNDIHKVDGGHAQLSAWCNPKGRMLALFRVFEREGALWLMLPAERLEPVLRRLRMFVLRARVELEDASERLARVELAGECAADRLPIDPPEAPDETRTLDGYTVLRLPGDRPRFQVFAEPEPLRALWEEAEPETVPTSERAWRLLDIRAGIPTVVDATAEAFVPQMANLHAIGGVSFTKGCYTGQEVVARMQYLGRLKRRMYRVACEVEPAPGAPLFSPHSASGQGAGRIVSAAPVPGGGFEALAVIEIAAADSGVVHLEAADGPALRLLDLPYEVATSR